MAWPSVSTNDSAWETRRPRRTSTLCGASDGQHGQQRRQPIKPCRHRQHHPQHSVAPHPAHATSSALCTRQLRGSDQSMQPVRRWAVACSSHLDAAAPAAPGWSGRPPLRRVPHPGSRSPAPQSLSSRPPGFGLDRERLRGSADGDWVDGWLDGTLGRHGMRFLDVFPSKTS